VSVILNDMRFHGSIIHQMALHISGTWIEKIGRGENKLG